MNLSIFVIVPLLMLLGLWLARNDKQVRGVMVAGASVLLGLSIYLVFAFLEARETMPADQAPMLFTYCVPWFEPLHINYSLGVDGISVVMILLTSIIVFTGTFASWQMEPMKKEYFLWFTLLSIGVYGFFISIDMFTMFMFYEVALIPMYLLIGVWGSGAKEYSAMKLTLMLMGGSAFWLSVSWESTSTVVLRPSKSSISLTILMVLMRFQRACRTCSSHCSSSVSVSSVRCSHSTHGLLMVTQCANSRIYVARRCIDEAWWLRLLPYRHVPLASCYSRILDQGVPRTDYYLYRIWCFVSMCTDRLEVHQRLLISISLWYGALRSLYDDRDSCYWCNPPDVVSRFDDRPLLRRYRYDLSSGWYT